MDMAMTPATWLKEAKKNAGWLIALGVLSMVVGVMAVGSPLVAGTSVAAVVGFFMLVVTDPDFDPAESAFYYVRVLDIPTPPWYAYDAFRLVPKCPRMLPRASRSVPTPRRSGTLRKKSAEVLIRVHLLKLRNET